MSENERNLSNVIFFFFIFCLEYWWRMAIEKYQKHDREVEKKSCENLMNQQREREFCCERRKKKIEENKI
jgi:hypothetical protein